MNQEVFFLHKDDVSEFQNRCVIAIFLDKHQEIEFVEYMNANAFLGKIDGNETMIYLFHTPEAGSKPGYVFKSNSNNNSNQAHQYKVFLKDFLSEYVDYQGNVYGYIKDHFFSEGWRKYQGNLFRSNEPHEKEVFKYKKRVEEASGSLEKYFREFLDGRLVFSNPITFNDPFDCDCDLPNKESLENLLWNAFNSLVYTGQGSTSVRKQDIEKTIKEIDDQRIFLNMEDVIWRIVEAGKADDAPSKVKMTKPETVRAIINNFKKMLDEITKMKESFRVFCTGKREDDILMWGYYCDGGNGVCCKYNHKNIIDSIKKDRKASICIYGNVKYENDKPQYHYTKGNLANNILDYVIRCVFTKYAGWKHEDEFRYVLIEPDFGGMNYISVPSEVQEYYLGCKVENSSATETYILSKGKSIKKLKKSLDKYELI